MKFFIIGCGGFIGALMRYSLSTWVNRTASGSFPYGTLVVNALGCMIIGCLMTLIEEGQPFSENLRLLLLVGLLGSFTTFSTFGWETFALFDKGELRFGAYNMVFNMALGLAALVLGRLSIRLIIA